MENLKQRMCLKMDLQGVKVKDKEKIIAYLKREYRLYIKAKILFSEKIVVDDFMTFKEYVEYYYFSNYKDCSNKTYKKNIKSEALK